VSESKLDLADVLKPLNIEEFEDPEEFREIVISMVSKQRQSQYFGNVGYFNVETYDPAIKSVRFGGGSMGGKARGLGCDVPYHHRSQYPVLGKFEQ